MLRSSTCNGYSLAPVEANAPPLLSQSLSPKKKSHKGLFKTSVTLNPKRHCVQLEFIASEHFANSYLRGLSTPLAIFLETHILVKVKPEAVPKWNEQDRLRALEAYEILDTPKEEDFEDIVQMAARACNVPIAVINFIARERQWFKAEVGLNVRETPLDSSFCVHAILQPGVFTIPDTTEDHRFCDNPLVKGEPRLRFYAGALLETHDGLPLGTMCVLDYKARVLTEAESATLKALARQVMTQLELRRALKAKNKSEERLNLALDASGFVGIWEWDVVNDQVYADSHFIAVFGGESHWNVEGAPLADFIASIHPDDFDRVKGAIQNTLTLKQPFQEEYRLRLRDGTIRWIEARGKCHFDPQGKPLRFPGVAVDITDRKQTEQKAQDAAARFKFMAESMPQKIWTAASDGHIDFFNQQWVEFTGLSIEQIRDLGWAQFIHPDDLEDSVQIYDDAIETGKPFEMQQRFRRKDGVYRWHLVRGSPMRDSEGKVVAWMGSNTDIDDQRKISEHLAETAAKFRALFDQSSSFAGIMSSDGVLLEANRTSLELCGYGEKEVVGKPFWECGWWSKSSEVQQIIRSATDQAARGIAYKSTLPYWLADGTERVVDFGLHPIRNSAETVIFLHPTGIDITERHNAQIRAEFISQMTQKLSTVSNPLDLNRIATSETGKFLNASRCYFFELCSEEDIRVLPVWNREEQQKLEGTYKLSDFGPPERWEALKLGSVAINDVRTHPWTKDIVSRYEALQIGACLHASFVQEGRWLAAIGVCSAEPRTWTPEEHALLEDVLGRVWPLIQRAKSEQALRESEQRFRALSDNIAPLAWMAHADGMIFWYNKRWYEYTGGTFETMKGNGWAQAHDPEHLPHVIESWGLAIAQGTPWEDTFPIRGRDGIFRWFLSRAFPIRDDKGDITLWFGVNTDISELRETQEALQKTNFLLEDKAALLESIVQQRTHKLTETVHELEAFSYSISHDMRAPLRSMIGYAEILKEEYASLLDSQGFDYLNRICAASRRMDQLIQDVLTYSRVSQEEVALQSINIDVMIREIVRTYPNLHADRAEIEIAPDLPPILGNEALLTQCISNLLDNGVKFTREGEKAKIKVWAISTGSRVKIHFQDQGIGMPPHSLERIFKIFQRVGRNTVGTGIGLAIVRRAIEKMGGTVGVESELGKGSLFWIDIAAP